jgi:hypothetical protein
LAFEFRGINLAVTVVDVEAVDIEVLKNAAKPDTGASPTQAAFRGILMQQTSISFVKAPDSSIRLVGTRFGRIQIIF